MGNFALLEQLAAANADDECRTRRFALKCVSRG